MNKAFIATICGIIFAAISTYCSAQLWYSFAEGTTDKIIAATIGGGFVVCMYLFHSNGNYLTTAVLFAISVVATMGWIESRYDSIKTTELSSDSSYSAKVKTLTELNNTLELQNLSAKSDLANTTINFTGRANRTLAQAKQTQHSIIQLEHEIKQLKNASPSSQKSGAAIANFLGDFRLILWFFLAAIVDRIPMTCSEIVKAEKRKSNDVGNKNNDTSNVANNVTAEPRNTQETSLKATPRKDATILSIVTEQDPLTETIASEITINRYGEKPSLRNVMKQHNLRHERTKTIFEQLVQMKIIQPQGNRYIRLETQNEIPVQEHKA